MKIGSLTQGCFEFVISIKSRIHQYPRQRDMFLTEHPAKSASFRAAIILSLVFKYFGQILCGKGLHVKSSVSIFQELLLVLTKLSFWEGDWAICYNFIKF